MVDVLVRRPFEDIERHAGKIHVTVEEEVAVGIAKDSWKPSEVREEGFFFRAFRENMAMLTP